jgi:hypothetical protein
MLGSIINSWMCITIGGMSYIVYQNNQNDIFFGPNPDFYIFGIFINAFVIYYIYVISFLINDNYINK